MITKDYEMVIGLEVHVELKTKTKIFCSCPTDFGAEPNTQCCPVCIGMPGTLPVLNQKVVEYAVKAGLATNCAIAAYSKQDRKNYFYPDLPKAYQISQYDLPLCEHGHLEIETESGSKVIGITRIHIEEDAGKLVHDPEKGTFIDCNRCGVPLIEIVSEPDIRSASEAVAYVKKLRAIILYTGISDCKMNEGSLRCDVNLSVRKKGTETFGTRTEMKNLNSFQSIARAIEYEYKRQVEIIESGETVIQETRRFDQNTGKTSSMRSKEDANDYRYFPDPDLAPIELSSAYIDGLHHTIPKLPDDRKAFYMEKFGLGAYDSELLTQEKDVADYFEAAAEKTGYPKQLANLIISEAFSMLPAYETSIPAPAESFAAIAEMLGRGRINGGTAKKLLRDIWENGGDPQTLVTERGLEQINDPAVLLPMIKEVISMDTKSVSAYKSGKESAAMALVGKTMALSKGRANPVTVTELLKAELSK